jgi:hypothetical protein
MARRMRRKNPLLGGKQRDLFVKHMEEPKNSFARKREMHPSNAAQMKSSRVAVETKQEEQAAVNGIKENEKINQGKPLPEILPEMTEDRPREDNPDCE